MTTQKTSATKLTELLQRLSEIKPAVCEKYAANAFIIGDYIFVVPEDTKELTAWHKSDNHPFAGSAALDWLAGAVMRECEARGWAYDTQFWMSDKQLRYRTYIQWHKENNVSFVSAAHALLAAFVAAVGAAQEGER